MLQTKSITQENKRNHAVTKVYVGTSGWHYAHWRGPFYPEGMPSTAWLNHYTSHFKCVEINNSFYQLPEAQTITEWYEQTPGDFLFTLKASRLITHLKKLRNCQEPLQTFLQRIAGLKEKLGPLLFQLPPRWHANPQRLDEFLALIPKAYRCAFEFRDPTWHNDEIYAVLKSHGAAFCIYDLGGFTAPDIVTADFVYVRLHGPDGPYAGSYHHRTLQAWERKVRDWTRKKKNVYVFFDNDQAAYAVKNALSLRRMLPE